MAISESVFKRSMSINVGGDDDAKVKAYTYNGIKTDAQVDKIHSAATALGKLMEGQVGDIVVTNKVRLTESL